MKLFGVILAAALSAAPSGAIAQLLPFDEYVERVCSTNLDVCALGRAMLPSILRCLKLPGSTPWLSSSATKFLAQVTLDDGNAKLVQVNFSNPRPHPWEIEIAERFSDAITDCE